MKRFFEIVKLVATKGTAFLPLLKVIANPKASFCVTAVAGGAKLSLYLENITKEEVLAMIEEIRK